MGGKTYLTSFERLSVEVEVFAQVQVRTDLLYLHGFKHASRDGDFVVILSRCVFFELIDEGQLGRVEFEEELLEKRPLQTPVARHLGQIDVLITTEALDWHMRLTFL